MTTNYYPSKFYKKPIEVDNIDGEIIVNITTNLGEDMIYSWYDIIDKTSYSPYIAKCLLGSFIKQTPKNVLIIGFGAGAYAKYLEDYISGVNIDGIEIDETMINIAKNEMKVRTKNFFIMDALNALKIIIRKKNKYDLIFIDVYDSNGKIPDYFEEKLLFKKINNILTNKGILILNYADYSGINIRKYDKIHNNIIQVFGDKFIHILNGKDDRGNISAIYNLDKEYNSEEVILAYLEKVQNGEINYDGNLIKNIVLSK